MGPLWVFCFLPLAALAQDPMLKDEGSGTDVVEAVVNSIEDSNLFHVDKLFLRRLAYVASKDGTDPFTYRTGYNGGIWQLDEEKFNQIKLSTASAALFPGILKQFSINWPKVTWSDLRKPMISGLAAALYLEAMSVTVPIPRKVGDQGSYYAAHYSSSMDSAHTFDLRAAALKDTPMNVYPGHHKYSCGQSQAFKFPGNLLIQINVTDGHVDIYGSDMIPTPNAGSNDFHKVSEPTKPAQIFSGGASRHLYLNIIASGTPHVCTRTFSMSIVLLVKVIQVPNLCRNRPDGFYKMPPYGYCFKGNYYKFSCREHQVYNPYVHACMSGKATTPPRTTPLVQQPTTRGPIIVVYQTSSKSGVTTIPNPCKNSLVKGDLMYYPYPNDPTKYIHCDGHGGGYVQMCPSGRIWHESLLACIQETLISGPLG